MNWDGITEEILTREQRFEGKIIRVEHWQVRLPNGRAALREIVVHPGGVAVVPVDERGQVTLVRQHRVAVGQMLLEIPAGKRDHPGEDPLTGAQRELSEETGLVATNWQLLTTMEPTPGYCTERLWIYLATGLESGLAHLDEDEFLHVERLPLSEAVTRVMRGELTDAKTALGLLMAAKVLGETER